MFNINLLDSLVIIIYLIAMVWIGLYFSKKVKGSEDFYLAGRSLGPIVIMATVGASTIGGGAIIGSGGVAYNTGVVTILIGIPYLIGMYVFSMISGRISKIGIKNRIASMPELMEYRFGKGVKYLTAALVAFTMMATVGAQVSATATILKTMGGLSYELGALIAVLIFTVYTIFSGLFGVVYTDLVQFGIILIMVLIVLPVVAVSKIGGFNVLSQSVAPEMLQLKPDLQVVGWIFTNLVFTIAGAEMWQRAFAAKDSKTAKRGMFLGSTSYGYAIVMIVILGLCGQVLLPDLIAQYGTQDAVIPILILEYLPVGLSGLTLAGLFAVLMSSADTYLLIAVQTIIKDIGKSIIPNMDDKTELRISRICTGIAGIGAFLVAFYFRAAFNALMFAWTFYAASLGIPAFASLFWKKATKQGMYAGIFGGFIVSCSWQLAGSPFGLGSSVPGSIVSALLLIIVSLSTYKKGVTPFPRL